MIILSHSCQPYPFFLGGRGDGPVLCDELFVAWDDEACDNDVYVAWDDGFFLARRGDG